jgi:predicted branched-subunit amino acid permease
MTLVESFLVGVWEFVVGDDWRTALGAVLALALTAVVATTAVSAWWIMPPAVVGLLALSIRRAAREASRHD